MPSMEKGLVVRHLQVGQDLFEMELITPRVVPECKPGQFVHVQVGQESFPILRRPLSLYDVDRHLGSVVFLYKVVGEGTRLLSKVRTKDSLNVMGPLGRGFTLPKEESNVLLVGGGVGIAPLVYLARVLVERRCQVRVLHGTQTREQLAAFLKLRQLGVQFMPATVDGSAGYKGLVTELLFKKIDPAWVDCIYTCGPEPMMARTADYARQYGIVGQASLEEHMACGVGACLGCARKLKTDDYGYAKICKDGPVFDLDELDWPGS